MADSTPMIAAMVAFIDTLPKTAAGDAKVEDPTALAVEFIGIVAPAFSAENDELLARAESAENLSAARQNELIGLRAEVDNFRSVVSQAIGSLSGNDVSAAQAVLATL